MILHALLSIDFKDLHLNPVLLPISWGDRHFFDIKWYSLAYIAGILGIIWLIGRIIYMVSYMAAPEKRAPGAIISTFTLSCGTP